MAQLPRIKADARYSNNLTSFSCIIPTMPLGAYMLVTSNLPLHCTGLLKFTNFIHFSTVSANRNLLKRKTKHLLLLRVHNTNVQIRV